MPEHDVKPVFLLVEHEPTSNAANTKNNTRIVRIALKL